MRTYLWACPFTFTPQPHLPFPCFCKIKMCGSSKMAWIDAVRTTCYHSILMLCCDVFMFFAKQGVPSDEDLEWLFIREKPHCYNESAGSNNMFWSIYFFYICYHAGGSIKHFRRPKVKRRDEESSPSDALTPKKRKTRLAGKMRTYLWACPLTATPQPHLPFPWFCKIKMCGSSKMAWIDAVRTTRYSLILMLCCDVSTFLVKQGVPSDEDLEWLYPSCSLYEKEFFRAFRSIAN